MTINITIRMRMRSGTVHAIDAVDVPVTVGVHREQAVRCPLKLVIWYAVQSQGLITGFLLLSGREWNRAWNPDRSGESV